jgi:hypothetical protein
MRGSRLVLTATLLAAAIAGAYLLWGPPSQDLAAATFRADLFSDHGFVIWNNAWYSGHYLLSYSVTYPPLGALLGPRLAGAAGAVAAAAIFAVLAGRASAARAVAGSLWFAAAVAVWLFTGRMPFLLAVPFGLAALLPSERGWGPALAAGLAAVCSLTSPIAGVFVAITGAALAVTGQRARGIAVAVGAIVPIAALNLAFPTGGDEPFVFSAFIAVPILAAAALWLLPRERADLRVGVVIYAIAALVVYLVPNAVGGNITRLGALLAGPTMALVLWPRGRLVVLAVGVPLLYWQLVAPVRDIRKAAGDPSTERAYFAPLNAELDRLAASEGAFRTEIPPTRNRWEAAYVAPDHPIARGWLRQLESDDFDLFSEDRLTPGGYRDWLDRHGVSYVAVPDAKPDWIAEDEVPLIDAGLDYLTPVWRSQHWRLYRVDRPNGLARAGVESIAPDEVVVNARRPGEIALPINWTRYWSVDGGDACVGEGGDGETVLDARRPGSVELGVSLGGDHCR